MGDTDSHVDGGAPLLPASESPLSGNRRSSASTSIASQHQVSVEPQYAFSNQFPMNNAMGSGSPSAYNMASMGHSLPDLAYKGGQAHEQGGHQRPYTMGPPPLALQMSHPNQHTQHTSQYPMNDQTYYAHHHQPQQHHRHQHMGQYYMGGSGIPGHGPPMPQRPGQVPQFYQTQPNMHQQPNSAYYYPQNAQYLIGVAQQAMGSMMPTTYGGGSPIAQSHRSPNPGTGENYARFQGPVRGADDGSDNRQSPVRGPPRKPRQSGHAIWIGNLPPQTDLMTLVQHVCKEAPGLESLFLISKSNCAFANYKDEPACISAQQKLHESKLQSVRLVSRLRKSTVESPSGTAAPTGPAAASPSPMSPSAAPSASESSAPVGSEKQDAENSTLQVNSGPTDPNTLQRDKFFILKSLTVEDLDLSVRQGVWATQSHNEDTLNNAYQNADNVYLVFSANKSGEYYGYARMSSKIDEDPAAAIEFAPTTHTASDTDLPKAIPTEATEFAPKGRIIDDSARGTIFWEIIREDSDAESDAGSETSSHESNIDKGEEKSWGKPFHLEWQSTNRLPFYRTRGLRNPWNSNREVKIARDGTELEPSVGRRLIGLFNRVQSPQQPGGLGRPAMGPVPPYPQMRMYGQ